MSDSKIITACKNYLKFWIKYLNLSDWKVETTYHTYLRASESGNRVVARTWASWEYLDAHIEFDLAVLRDMDEDEIERAIIHELLHVVVNEMRDPGVKHEERVVSSLSRVLWWMKNLDN